MAEFPALPLWTDAYLADTTHLSTEEHGAYLLLLFAAWRLPGCALPDDDRVLSRIVRAPERRWTEKLRPAVVGFFTITEGVWRQKRLTSTRENVEAVRAKRREARAKVGQAKSLESGVPPPTIVTTNEPTLVPVTKAISISNKQQQDTELPPREAAAPSWQELGRAVCHAAGIDEARMAVDFSEAIGWTTAGFRPDLVLAAVRAVAARPGYKPPRSLRYFTQAIRDAHEPPKPGSKPLVAAPARELTEAERRESDERWLRMAREQRATGSYGGKILNIPQHITERLDTEERERRSTA